MRRENGQELVVEGSQCARVNGELVPIDVVDSQMIHGPERDDEPPITVSYQPILHMMVRGRVHKADEWGEVTRITLIFEEI